MIDLDLSEKNQIPPQVVVTSQIVTVIMILIYDGQNAIIPLSVVAELQAP